MIAIDTERRQALIDLMSLADAPEMRRGHHRTLEGRADRHLMLRDLAARFVQWHMIELEERTTSWRPGSLE